ncbi:MAG: DsbA family protein [Gammaproteobacteria bacterium]|nr:MAG: DsbA family protein [Gammaproteobacteria bacterium]
MSELKLPVGPGDHVQGPRDAAITLVEYGDFECPFCGEAYPELKIVQRAMGNRLCFVFRNFPLSNMHPHAERAAEFAEGAATIGHFWEMHDLLYENQEALEQRNLTRYATELGLSHELIQSAIRGDFAERICRDFTGGVRSGVNGTPCLFINGRRFDGPATAAALLEVLRSFGED